METMSLFAQFNNLAEPFTDENGNILNGTRITEDNSTIVRFRNGYLDGDIYKDNVFVMQKPAVETAGHIEYWRKNKLHRDNGLEAVCSKGFTVREYWIDGVRQEQNVQQQQESNIAKKANDIMTRD